MTTIDKERKNTGSKKGGKLLSCATLLLLALGSQSGYAAEVGTAGTCGGVNDANVTDVTKPVSNSDTTGVIDLYQGMANVQSSQSEVTDSTNEQLGDVLKPENNESPKNSKIHVYGGGYLGVGMLGDFANLVSDNPTFIGYFGAKKELSKGVTIGGNVVRVTDFSNDPNYPVSKVTEINPYVKFGNNNYSVTGELKYDLIDKLPEANGLAADIVGSYSTQNGWTFEGTYTHRFNNKGKDSDAIRFATSVQLTDAFTLTGYVWGDTGYDKKVYARLNGTYDLGSGVNVQGGTVFKNGKTTRTVGVSYNF